jgi:hypothetical protein
LKVAIAAPSDAVHIVWSGRSFLSEYHRVSRYTCKCNFIYIITFPALTVPIFTKLINTQQHYMESSSAEFHTNL